MKLSCSANLALAALLAGPAFAGPDSAAFYYGSRVPESLYSAGWLVTDLRNLAEPPLRLKGQKLICYASAGEFEPGEASGKKADAWTLGANAAWKTLAGDLRKPDYRAFVAGKIAALAPSCDGFFIDTLDSYTPFVKEADRPAYAAASAAFLEQIKSDWPDKLLVLNRGFELLPLLKPGTADAVAAESLYYGIDPAARTYRAMKPEETAWLRDRLREVSASGLPVIVIDYLPPGHAGRAKAAATLASDGFIPYVSDMDLMGEGETGLSPVKRRVLLVAGNTNDIYFSPLHAMAQLPLEYLGYDTVLLKESEVMARRPDPSAYAGVIVWLEYSRAANPEAFRTWIMEGLGKGAKFLFVNSFGFEPSPANLASLGLRVRPDDYSGLAAARITASTDLCGFEGEPRLAPDEFLLSASSGTPVMTARTEDGQNFHPAALMPWGGYAFYSSLVSNPVGEDLWTIDPFRFLPAALGLPELPAPDITTANGRRLFFSHLDGDGFVEPAEWDNSRIAAEVIRDELIKKYPFPFTVSVIEGEISAAGAYPARHKRYENIARSIFSLPNVEPAIHSFSHPFIWGVPYDTVVYEKHHLDIPGYVLDYKREIFGARDYVNSLLPSGRRTELFHWTGNCLPNAEQLKLSREAGLLNINGGGATIMNFLPWLSRVRPAFLERAGELQIFSPIQNENVFTEGWKHPFYRFMQVMETIKLTGEPRRLKPINVYFHFFSGSKQSSVNALRKVYNWVSTLETTPVTTTQWLRLAADFKTSFLARDASGAWLLRNAGRLRTLRAPASFGVPDLKASSGLAGFKEEKGLTYIHLDGSGSARVVFTKAGAAQPAYIENASALLDSFERKGRGFSARLRAEAPGQVLVRLPQGCAASVDGKASKDGKIKFAKGTINLNVDCE
ncbi:MAG: endo alpha-1,4 polygalactosaminidase [Elusimicrobiales bacterium]